MILIIAGMAGVGKSTLAKFLAKEFNLTFLDGGDMMKEMAVEAGLKPTGDEWWETEEGMKFLEIRKSDSTFDKRLDKKLIDKAEELNNVVMTSWAVPWLYDKGFKIYLKGTFNVRSKRISGRDSTQEQAVKEKVKERDERNIKHYKTLYGFNISADYEPFDLIINTDLFGIEEIKNILINIINKLKNEPQPL
ncbi:MAG: cytidylate kinase family protein [Nanoarchaeota archaeon]|nr:cytidylate kinase family protein [Nanoarchaeota archaeon]